jgi:hypothetical protein
VRVQYYNCNAAWAAMQQACSGQQLASGSWLVTFPAPHISRLDSSVTCDAKELAAFCGRWPTARRLQLHMRRAGTGLEDSLLCKCIVSVFETDMTSMCDIWMVFRLLAVLCA